MGLTAILLVALTQSQVLPRPDPEHLAEARRLAELALYDRAEEILRNFLKAAPAEPQFQKLIPDFRAALCEVLLAARKYDDLKAEAEALRRHPKTRVHALS